MTDYDTAAVEARRRAQQVALFRYRVICPALDPGLSTRQRGKIVRDIVGEVHDHPFHGEMRYSRQSVDRWIGAYREGGFDALAPAARTPGPRTDAQTLDLAAALKAEVPGRTAAQVARILTASTGWSPSESTLLRLFHRRELMGPAADTDGEVYRVLTSVSCPDCGVKSHCPVSSNFARFQDRSLVILSQYKLRAVRGLSSDWQTVIIETG